MRAGEAAAVGRWEKGPVRPLPAALAIALFLAAAPGPAAAQRAGGAVRSARADLADMASGTYSGGIVSDARGQRRGVRITVARTGPNQVRVASDDPRLPAFGARLERTGDMLRNVGGEAVFLLDLARSPRTLIVTVDGASWSGSKD